MRATPVSTLTLSLTVLGVLALSAPPLLAAAAPEGRQHTLRPALPPSPLARARVARWHRTWTDEAGVLERRFQDALRAAEAHDDRVLQRRCVALAGALVELERPRVLPVPDRAADLHVRRGLRHAARAALTCLTKRPYAARRALEQAAEAFGEAGRILRRYGLAPDGADAP